MWQQHLAATILTCIADIWLKLIKKLKKRKIKNITNYPFAEERQ
jgi:hypothetical protein